MKTKPYPILNTQATVTEFYCEQEYPWIEWREPLPTSTPDGSRGYTCRFCAAMRGFEGYMTSALPQTKEEFFAHMQPHLERLKGAYLRLPQIKVPWTGNPGDMIQ